MKHPGSGLQPKNSQLPAILNIRLLGGFHLSYQGETVHSIKTPRLQSLLAYLVLHKDTPIYRQHLAFLLWPDSSEPQSRTNLRNLLYGLRSALPDSDRYLYTDKHTLQWRQTELFKLDVDEFFSLASDPATIQDLKTAVEAYSGDLLPECYEEWIQPLRENLCQTYLTALEKLLESLAEIKRPREALHYAQILLRKDPVREETYRQLMRLHAQLGDRANVVRTYKTCVTVLKRELDVNPGAATDAAYRKWLAHHTDWSSYLETKAVTPEINDVHHNLPASLTTFIGRQQEIEQLTVLLSKHRLITLSGIGGVGKTRLALAVANEMQARFLDGLFLVDLASISDSDSVVPTIADALYASDEVRASGLDGLTDHLSDQNLLLILDNCEHLTEKVGKVTGTLLRACPELTILATSRIALKVQSETVWQVPPLPVPQEFEEGDDEDIVAQAQALRANESVELFVERAASNLPTFRPTPENLLSIGEICRRLEGIPLAIEMAAARIKMFSVPQIAQRLDDAIGFLQHPATDISWRHQAMDRVMNWSYAMLDSRTGKLFARLGIFAGDFSLQAVETVCAGQGIQKEEILDLLAGLVEQSLVQTLQTLPEARFRLHEIARQYAYQKLQEQNKTLHWQDRHLDYFVRLAEEAEPELKGRRQAEWLDRLELERENLRAALRRTLGIEITHNGQKTETLARLVKDLWIFWFIRGRFSEGRSWAEQSLVSLEGANSSSPFLGKILYVLASFCLFQGDLLKAEALSQKSLVVCKANQDHFGVIMSYYHLGIISWYQGDLAMATKHSNQGLELADRYGDSWLTSVLNIGLSNYAKGRGESQAALEYNQQALDISRKHGDKLQMLYALANIGEIMLEQENIQQAAMFIEESLTLSRLIGEKRMIASNLHLLGRIAMQEKKHRQADDLFKQSLRLMWSTRDRRIVTGYLVDMAENAYQQGNSEIAARLLAACGKAQTDPRGEFQLENQATFERLVEEVRTRLGEGVFTAAWTLGGLMSLGQAVAFALAAPGD